MSNSILSDFAKLSCLVVSLSLLVSCASPVRLNEIQIIGSHNSYKQAIDPDLMKQIAVLDSNLAASLDYSHLTIPAQLNRGLRKFELDVFYDPEGRRYQTPAGLNRIATARPYNTDTLALPGFKVMHVQDIDFRSHCPRLRACLQQFVSWSDKNANHLPVFITINAKDGVINVPGFVKPLLFNEKAWNELDEVFVAALGQKLYTPDEFRGGEQSLPEAIKRGWPTLDSMRGRFVVVLDHGGEKLAQYISGHPALQGRAMFVNATEGAPESAIRIVNDPIKEKETIMRLVQQGYIVRTRSDADTVEARTGRVDRRNQAFAGGAQIISTDYYLPEPRFGTDFVVQFPNGTYARCNPVLRPKGCEIKD